jgi:hypothetical protein
MSVLLATFHSAFQSAPLTPSPLSVSQTVTGILTPTYSIFASTEGTWRVTMVEDRWCRYPPLVGTAPAASGEDKLVMLEGIDPFPPLIKN